MNAIIKAVHKAGRSVLKLKPVAKVAVKVSKNKPEIMAYTGGAMIIFSFVMAIVAGTKVNKEMELSAAEVEELEKKQAEQLSVDNLTEEQKSAIIKACGKDLAKTRAKGVWRVTKLFILPGVGLVVGLTLFGGGFRILKKRNVVLGIAAEGYKKTLDFYRKNVIATEGEEADKKYMRGVVGEQSVTDIQKGEDGKEKKTTKKVQVVKDNKDHQNPWRFMFNDIYFRSYEDDPDRNLFFLKCAQDWWKHQYEERGEDGISMYDILFYLGYNFEVDKDGMTREQYRDWITFLRNYGWRKGCGDDFIDFGLYRAINEAAVKCQSDMIWIEFNTAGNLQELPIRK